jgi:integrase
VRYNEDGPLKEDKGDTPTPKVKWAPAPDDVVLLLTSWLAKREIEKAEPEHFLFRAHGGGFITKMQRSRAWTSSLKALNAELKEASPDPDSYKPLELTWYEASRHSFASRNLEAGVPLEEVSGALGHSTPAVTLRHYSRFVRKDYSDAIRRGLKLVPEGEAKVLVFASGKATR